MVCCEEALLGDHYIYFRWWKCLWCIRRTDNTRIAHFEPTEIRLDTFVSRCVCVPTTKCNNKCNKNVRPQTKRKIRFICVRRTIRLRTEHKTGTKNVCACMHQEKSTGTVRKIHFVIHYQSMVDERHRKRRQWQWCHSHRTSLDRSIQATFNGSTKPCIVTNNMAATIHCCWRYPQRHSYIIRGV